MVNFIYSLVSTLFYIYFYMVLIYVFMSWVPQVRESSIGRILGRLVEPYLGIFRRFIPPIGIVDISPIIALIALNLAQTGLLEVLRFIFRLIGLQ